MPVLRGKLGNWNVPELHAWKDRALLYKTRPSPILTPTTRIATIGSCFAEELAAAMQRLGLAGGMHPGGLFYTPRCIRQELDRMWAGSTLLDEEPAWRTREGWVYPIRDHHLSFLTEAAMRKRVKEMHDAADALFASADVIVVTLGLIESWESPTSAVHYNQIPHPDVFARLGARFRRLTVGEISEDLERIYSLVRAHTKAELVITVSPVPLHSTMTPLDVRVANTESKSRLRAAVSELVERHPDVHYFHSYEIVTNAERASDFMLEDGRHVSRQGVDYILSRFMAQFASPGLPLPTVSDEFLTRPEKTAARPAEPPNLGRDLRRALRKAVRRVWMHPMVERARSMRDGNGPR